MNSCLSSKKRCLTMNTLLSISHIWPCLQQSLIEKPPISEVDNYPKILTRPVYLQIYVELKNQLFVFAYLLMILVTIFIYLFVCLYVYFNQSTNQKLTQGCSTYYFSVYFCQRHEEHLKISSWAPYPGELMCWTVIMEL